MIADPHTFTDTDPDTDTEVVTLTPGWFERGVFRPCSDAARYGERIEVPARTTEAVDIMTTSDAVRAASFMAYAWTAVRITLPDGSTLMMTCKAER